MQNRQERAGNSNRQCCNYETIWQFFGGIYIAMNIFFSLYMSIVCSHTLNMKNTDDLTTMMSTSRTMSLVIYNPILYFTGIILGFIPRSWGIVIYSCSVVCQLVTTTLAFCEFNNFVHLVMIVPSRRYSIHTTTDNTTGTEYIVLCIVGVCFMIITSIIVTLTQFKYRQSRITPIIEHQIANI
jgi:hypothetical protein